MGTVRVSVIIPCYKSGETVLRAVNSVFRQTWLPAEVILVDDCSPDDTLMHLYAIQKRFPDGWIKIVELSENVGAGSARNRGWDVATQDYIAFLDSDDSWHHKKVEVQYGWMLDNPQAALTGVSYVQVTNVHKPYYSGEKTDTRFTKISAREILFSNKFSTPTVMLRRDIPLRFLEGKRFSEDYLLWLEIVLSGVGCYKSAAPLVYIYKDAYGEGGLSSNLWEMEKGQLETYWFLHRNKKVSAMMWLGLSVYSFLKYLRRVYKVRFGVRGARPALD